MPFSPPPDSYSSTPHDEHLPAGTELWRVHPSKYASTAFNSTRTHRFFGGGRFDGTDDDPYSYIYAGFTKETAVCETLLRDVPFEADTPRMLLPDVYEPRSLSRVVTTTDLKLLSLRTTPHLSRAYQDTWLVNAGNREYAQTRHWGHWYRYHITWAQGLIWPSKRDVGNNAIILFGDRCTPHALLDGSEAYDFNTAAGRAELSRVLQPLTAII
ncbi:RES family NAD+ phosphorylase [Nocardia sp. CA-135398]|uniref:RES family NAD+ phosphorylase n=1 Tax=Nocardia sp. CA-135398 TaxID=3239977 RepID=UPI003D95FFB1